MPEYEPAGDVTTKVGVAASVIFTVVEPVVFKALTPFGNVKVPPENALTSVAPVAGVTLAVKLVDATSGAGVLLLPPQAIKAAVAEATRANLKPFENMRMRSLSWNWVLYRV